MDLQELVATIENLADNCQRILMRSLKEILYKQKGPTKLKPSTELDHIVDIGILVCEGGYYAIAETAKKKIRKLYTYLQRKYDTELYFDIDSGDTKEIPKGAEFVYSLSLDGQSKLALQFPDDEVTDLLNLFGVNRCDTWPV